jgi:hypothetical protein
VHSLSAHLENLNVGGAASHSQEDSSIVDLQQDKISHEEDAVMADTKMPDLPRNPNLGSQLVQRIMFAKLSNIANMLVANATASSDKMPLAVHSSLLQLTRIVQRQSADFTAPSHRVLTQAEQSNATSARNGPPAMPILSQATQPLVAWSSPGHAIL